MTDSPNRSRQELYLSKFTGDELTLVPIECPHPWACKCGPNDKPCGLTAEEARLDFVRYFHEKAAHYASLTTDEFMVELGFYTYQK